MSVQESTKIVPYPASQRAHSQSNWLIIHRSFNFRGYSSQDFEPFGPIRILDEDRVSPVSDFQRISIGIRRSSPIFSPES